MLQAGKTDPEADTPKGLLTKIIHVLMLERADSIYRFWLASCVESYLRGSCPEEQVFVAKTGLLGHLIREILSDVRVPRHRIKLCGLKGRWALAYQHVLMTCDNGHCGLQSMVHGRDSNAPGACRQPLIC